MYVEIYMYVCVHVEAIDWQWVTSSTLQVISWDLFFYWTWNLLLIRLGWSASELWDHPVTVSPHAEIISPHHLNHRFSWVLRIKFFRLAWQAFHQLSHLLTPYPLTFLLSVRKPELWRGSLVPSFSEYEHWRMFWGRTFVKECDGFTVRAHPIQTEDTVILLCSIAMQCKISLGLEANAPCG